MAGSVLRRLLEENPTEGVAPEALLYQALVLLELRGFEEDAQIAKDALQALVFEREAARICAKEATEK